MPLTVTIVGGGIGGLCLAHGLRRADIRVTVYEKGPRRADPHWLQGYQIHINPNGAKALQECLPPPLWKRLVANACVPSTAFQVLTEQMNRVAVVKRELMNGSSHVPIVRTTLRNILLEWLSEVVQFEKEFVRFERKENGKVTAFFQDGTTVTSDVLVGADGTGSNVSRQYLARARIRDTNIVDAACRVPLDAETRYQLPEHLLNRLTSVVPPRSTYMVVTQSIHEPNAEQIGDSIGDHLIWVFVSSRAIYGIDDPKAMHGGAIKTLVLRTIDKWHPTFRRLVAESDIEQVAAVPVLTSIPIDRWEPSNVTLLGDAIHTMTPLQGLGGSTTLRDAELLCRRLIEIAHGRTTLAEGIRNYEPAMVDYGFRAVRMSACFERLVVSDSWWLRAGFKAALRFATHVPAILDGIFRASKSF